MTTQELAENNAFLNAVLSTAPMNYAFKWVYIPTKRAPCLVTPYKLLVFFVYSIWLVKNRKFSGDKAAFKRKLDQLWCVDVYLYTTCLSCNE